MNLARRRRASEPSLPLRAFQQTGLAGLLVLWPGWHLSTGRREPVPGRLAEKVNGPPAGLRPPLVSLTHPVHKLDRGRRAALAVSVQYYKRPSQPSPGSWGLQRLGPPGAAPDAGNPHTDLFCHSFQVRRWSRSPTICCLRRDEQEERRDAGKAGTAKLMAHGSPGNRPARRRSGAGSGPGRTSRPPLNLHGVTLTAQPQGGGRRC